MLFHKFPEEGRIDEIEAIGNLLDALVRMLQIVFDTFYGVRVDDGQRTLSTDFLDNGGQVFGCKAKLVGIVRYRAMASIVLCHFLQELAENVHGAVVAETGEVLLIGDGPMESPQYFTEDSREEMLLGLLAIGMFFLVDAGQHDFLI